MKVYTFSQARQNFSSVLDSAEEEGAVRITHRDGRSFTIQPVRESPSPLAVRRVNVKLSRRDILEAVRESREHGPRR
jgi:prevent-host-death family protein